jgi:hypothetical protein
LNPWTERHLGPDDGAQARTLGRLMKTRRAVNTVAIPERQRRIAEPGSVLDQVLGQRRTGEETESAAAAQLNVARLRRASIVASR